LFLITALEDYFPAGEKSERSPLTVSAGGSSDAKVIGSFTLSIKTSDGVILTAWQPYDREQLREEVERFVREVERKGYDVVDTTS